MLQQLKKVRVLIVDDSALVRKILTAILQNDPGIDVVGVAPDPYLAREKIKILNPDVLTLDVEMPRMDGVTFLGNLMRLRPMPVVMVSSLTEHGANITIKALELGAVDFVTKPKADLANTLGDYAEEIIGKVKNAACANVRRLARTSDCRGAGSDMVFPGKFIDESRVSVVPRSTIRKGDLVIAIGASTGGIEAIKEVLIRMPADSPAIVITQHIPPVFSTSFAKRLDEACAMTVCEAEDGQRILPGHAYIAPGGRHLQVRREQGRLQCRIHDGPPVNHHRPSVDVMFHSVVQSIGANAIGLIMTGMGDDGARGLKALREAGASTFAQDEDSSVVWGMPGEAVKLGAVEKIAPLSGLAAELVTAVRHCCGSDR